MTDPRNIIIGFSVSMLACFVANLLFGTCQLPEGIFPYWVLGAAISMAIFRSSPLWFVSVPASRRLPEISLARTGRNSYGLKMACAQI